MLDYYEDIAVVSDLKVVPKLLSESYKKIYLRKRVSRPERTFQLEWVSPYVQLPESSYYLLKENDYLFFGNVKTVYFNPRYSTQRAELRKFLCGRTEKDIGIIGAGIGPFSVYLSGEDTKTTEYEINPDCIRFSKINHVLNKSKGNIRHVEHAYDGTTHELLISVMPSVEYEFYDSISFGSLCVLYVLGSEEEIDAFTKKLEVLHDARLTFKKKVRPYCKGKDSYRLVLEKNRSRTSVWTK